MLDNIRNSGSVPSAKKDACVAAAKMMLENDFDPRFVAGLLANIISEGNTGIFESSNYKNNEPVYLQNMDKYYDYRSKYSGKYIYNTNLADVSALVTMLHNSGWYVPGHEGNKAWRAGFGLGSIQWTWERTYNLVQAYLFFSPDGSAITQTQAMLAEVKMMADEIGKTGYYHPVYLNWLKRTNPTAYWAGYDVSLKYESPAGGTNEATTRGNLATKIYADMTS